MPFLQIQVTPHSYKECGVNHVSCRNGVDEESREKYNHKSENEVHIADIVIMI